MAKRTELQIKMRFERERRGWTLQVAADGLGISKGHLHDIESGRHKNPTLGLLKKIRLLYGICLTCE
jgi:transcriptional regulator with XRE-family HTH domain